MVLDEAEDLDKSQVKRIVMCSGRVYYDLLEKRHAEERNDIALIRIEQLYPFPEKELETILSSYPNADTVVWCQEEPMNQGAWYCSQHHMRHVVARIRSTLYLHYAGRQASAAPAAGYLSVHVEEQKKLLEEAFTIE